MKRYSLWVLDFCANTGELFLAFMALRYAWLISTPKKTAFIQDAIVAETLIRVLTIAAPLWFWTGLMVAVGLFQLLALHCDFLVRKSSLPVRILASKIAMLVWALIAYSFSRAGEPMILWATFAGFSGFAFFLMILLHREKRRHEVFLEAQEINRATPQTLKGASAHE